MDELVEATKLASNTPKGKWLLKYLAMKTDDLMHPIPPINEQRVENTDRLAARREEKTVIDESPIITIPRISNSPTVIKSNKPTAKWVLKETKCLHR
jgi:hypothetical protein